MMEENKLVPKRRFEGFEDKWRTAIFNELGSFGKTYAFSRADEGFGEYFHVHYGDIHVNFNGLINKETRLPALKVNGNFETLKNNDLVIADASEDYVDLGKAVVIEDIDNRKVIAGSHTFKYTPNNNLDSKFYLYYSQSWLFKKFSYQKGTGISVFGISKDNLSKMKFNIPVKDEQQKIGQFFKHLDEMITLQQKKIDKTKALKSAYLAEMFPAEGERVPKRRFKGFTDEWKKVKLGNLTNINTGESDAQDSTTDGKYPFFVRSENVQKSNRYTFDGEAILIPGEGRLGEIYHHIIGKFDYHQRVYKISNFDKELDGMFVYYTMHKTFKKHALKHTVKATVDSLRLPMLTEYELLIPTVEEQINISEIFKNLDDIIANHQQKLEKLKATKQAYLNEMFV